MGLDLSACLQAYHERFPYDPAAIEKRFEDHRAGRKSLTASDVRFLFHSNNAPFGNYWPEPNKKILDQLSRRPLRLDSRLQDEKDKEDLVRRLLGVVHDIGVASVILRFVHPNCFGVFSSPVHALLLVNRRSVLELYLAYCDELIAYKEKFHLSSVAEVEMALTGLYEIMKGEGVDSEDAQREFQKHIWVQRKRAENVVRPFLRGRGKLELAKILVREDPSLAAMIAREEYDRRLQYASRKYRQCELPREKDAGTKLLDWLECKDRITLADKRNLKRVYRVCSEAVHARSKPSAEKVDRMIDAIEKICKDWKPDEENSGAAEKGKGHAHF
jgi:hypothetical protein